MSKACHGYLGLHAPQHRGQEAAGTAMTAMIYTHRAMGYVAGNFDRRNHRRIAGRDAAGHVRYSTTGETSPATYNRFMTLRPVDLQHVHNTGNISSAAMTLRRDLSGVVSIFSINPDTEVIIHSSRPQVIGRC
jgi:amidophosphoribosyltransferase